MLSSALDYSAVKDAAEAEGIDLRRRGSGDADGTISAERRWSSNSVNQQNSISVKRRTSATVLLFEERTQELVTVTKRLSDSHHIDESDKLKFELELRGYQHMDIDAIAAEFNTSYERGLNKEQVEVAQGRYGKNSLPKPKEIPLWIKFILSFFSGFAPLLWVSALFVFLSWKPFGTPPSNIYNLALAIVLLIVIFISGMFSFYQEATTSQVLSTFSNFLPTECTVIRDGTQSVIDIQDITLGDIIKLVAGSRIPADIRIIEQSGLKLDKSMLTGESEAVKMISSNVPADVPMLEALNMAFMGSNIVEGGGLGIVIAIGANTQLAKIFQKVSDFDIETTSLQKEIDRFVRIIATFALVTIIAVILHWTFYLRVEHEGFMTPSSMLANAISVFVAFVPQGLPLALSMGLTIICRRLCATHKVLVKQMSTIETVGSMNMLASDKTGTLTQNLMTVSDIILFEQTVDVATFAAIDEKVKIAVMEVAVMCNQAHYDEEENERNTSDGSSEVDGVPTINNSISGGNEVDRALLKFSIAGSMWKSVVTSQRHRVNMPFNSSTKIAAVVVARNGNLMSAATLSDTQSSVYVKGAPEYILERCSHFLQQHEISDMTIEASRSIQERINVLSNQGKRVIALARYNILPSEEKQMYQVDPTPNFPLTGLTFICCIAVSDPPRVGVLEAVTTIRGAGIAVAMVTGDAPTTAAAIARKVGIITATTATRFCDIIRASALSLDDIEARITTTDALVARTALQKEPSAIIVEGKDLIGITEQQWDRVFEFSEMVFARTTPENKLEIVKECQRRGRRVGVTGDGVNDSPALKVADIGIAMGSGSEVSRDAAAIVLLTDNFASIVHGIEEGRLIFANLRKVIAFQIAAGCWSELLPVLATFFVGMPTPLSSFLMIIISCMTDVYGGVALMWESPESALMLQSPRNRETQPLVTSVLVAYSYLFYGTLEAIAAFSTYFIYMANRGPTNVVADPIPSDDNGNLNFPAGYTMSQLLFAWNWGSNSGNLGRDTMLAGNVGSFVFFVVLIVCQWGHLCSVRRSMPYLSDAILNIRNEPKPLSSRIIAELSTWRPNLRVLAAISFSALTAVLFTETPAIQASCGTGSVPPVYWGIAIAFSFGIFVLAEIRKWLLVLYPRWLGWLVW